MATPNGLRAVFLFGPILGTLLGPLAVPTTGQTYPTRPVKLVVGFAAGAAADVSARILAFRVQGIEPLPSGPADYARYIATETAKWSEVVVQAGLVK